MFQGYVTSQDLHPCLIKAYTVSGSILDHTLLRFVFRILGFRGDSDEAEDLCLCGFEDFPQQEGADVASGAGEENPGRGVGEDDVPPQGWW